MSLDLGVEDEDESTTSASKDVGEGSLEEGFGTFVGEDLLEAMSGIVVHLFASARVHHESSSDGIERVRDDSGGDGNALSESPQGKNVGGLGVGEHHGFTSIEHTEVGSAVGNDTDDRDSEASVKTGRAVLGKDGLEAVNESSELTVST